MNADEKPLTVSVPEAGKLLGLSRNGAYDLAARGEIPMIRVGKRLLIPMRAIDAMLDSATENWRERQKT
jgi:excisionase family DNA binding protein